MALSLGALLAFAGGAAADTAKADGDVLTSAIEATANLGPVAPGEIRTVDIGIVLTCTGTSHMDPGQTITAGIDSAVAPEGGAVLSVTDATLGPVPSDWPAESAICPSPAPTLSGGTPSVVTLQAPMTPGTGYKYSLMYHRAFDPFGLNDGTAIRQATVMDIYLDVVINTPPTLTLPAVASGGPVEANATGGWTADWTGLGATDAEDVPAPTPGCDPAAGTLMTLGTNPVTCSVTDGGGLSDSGTFDLTVQDTTAPTLTGMPGDRSLTTDDPTGTTLTYRAPGATDIADADPMVGCRPASGSHIGLGTTKVTCTATDGSGNSASASFDVSVTYVAPHSASAVWGEPVAGSGTVFSANRGRNVPIKVELSIDGTIRTSGDARLRVTPCAGGDALTMALSFGGGRWNASLDTATLVGACHTVAASINGLQAGSFRLDLRGVEPLKANGQPASTSAQPTKPTKTKP
ncbi:MAG: hypothetical protein QOD78_1999 [Chloroflexota bacterium]|nr:hypothetical protein [Chloroflexota bacterium]